MNLFLFRSDGIHPFISSMTCPEPSKQYSYAASLRWTGFILPTTVIEILSQIGYALHVIWGQWGYSFHILGYVVCHLSGYFYCLTKKYLIHSLAFAAKAEPISVIWREHLKNAQFFLKFVDSTHIHVTCKFARHCGKDCENEVHVNLDFRIKPINYIVHALNH